MKIGIADPQGRVRFSLRVLLEQQPGWIVDGEVADCDELFEMLKRISPDLLLLDWDLPNRVIGDVLRRLRAQHPKLKIIVMSGRSELQQTAMKEGADAFACKADSPEKLLTVIQTLCDENSQPGKTANDCSAVPSNV